MAFDTSKLRNAVAIAEAGQAGEVRFLVEIENTEAAIAKLVRKLGAKYLSRRMGQPSVLTSSKQGVPFQA